MRRVLHYLVIVLFSILLGFFSSYMVLNRSIDFESVKDSIVYIEVFGDNFSNTGSGFVYDTHDGKNYILTNYHVIQNSNKIYVYNEAGKKEEGYVLNYDEYSDIAIITIQDDLNLNSAKIGNSSKVKVGDDIYTIGAPLKKYFGTVSKGIVSYVDRELSISTNNGVNKYSVIQIDSSINNGNSGGPLVNKRGEVIGIIFIKEENMNDIGFAYPIDKVMQIVMELENK